MNTTPTPNTDPTGPQEPSSALRANEPRWEWTPRRVQNILLSIGAMLCSVATLSFIVYAWDLIGLGPKVAIVGAVTAMAGIGGLLAKRRGLHATAEAVTTICSLLALIDAGAAYTLGLAGIDALAPAAYASIVCAGLTAVTLAYRAAVPMGATGWFALVVGQLAAPAAVIAAGGDPMLWAGAMGVQVLTIGALAHGRKAVLRGWFKTVASGAAIATAALVAVLGLGAAVADNSDPLRAGAPLAIVALTALAAPAVIRLRAARAHDVFTSWTITVAAAAANGAALAVIFRALPYLYVPLAISVLGLVTLLAARLAGSSARTGALVTGMAVSGVAVLCTAVQAVVALIAPVTRVLDAGTLSLDAALGAPTLATRELAEFTLQPLVFLTLGVVALSSLLLRSVIGKTTSIALAIPFVVVGGIGTVLSFDLGLFSTAMLFTAAAVGCTVLAVRRLDVVSFSTGGAAALLVTEAIALASVNAELTSFVVAVVGLTAVMTMGIRRAVAPYSAPVAVAAFAVSAAVLTSSVSAASAWVGVALTAVGVVGAVLTRMLAREDRAFDATLIVASTLSFAGFIMTLSGGAAFSVTLLLVAAAAAVLALHPRDRQLLWASATALVLFTWVRCTMAEVTTLEAYSLPLAALVLALGHVLGRRLAQQSSWTSCGVGLVLATLPSIYMVFSEDGIVRLVALAAAAVAIMNFGAQRRLQAPLIIGTAVLVIEAIAQFGPVASTLPPWVAILTAGVVLLGLGVTWERRYENLQNLRTKYETLR